MNKLIENGRAEYAYSQVKQICCDTEDKKQLKEYRALVRSLPSMIQVNGFAAAVAFLYAKRKNDPHNKVYLSIFNWLKQQKILNSDEKELMEAVTKQSRDGYKRMTWETMSLLSWIKRFAEGMIEVE